MPTPTLNNHSSFDKLFKQLPNYLKLKQFGCPCYPLTRPYNKHKLEPKAKPCTFMGYNLSQNAYICFEPCLRKIITSCHVIFHEVTFLFKKSNLNNFISPLFTATTLSAMILLPQLTLAPLDTTNPPDVGIKFSSLVSRSSPKLSTLQVSSPSVSSPLILSQTPPVELPEPTISELNKVLNHHMTTWSMNDIYKPKNYIFITKYPLPFFLEPTSVTEALIDSKWLDVMSSELIALMRYNT